MLGGFYRVLTPWLAPAVERELSRRVVSGLWTRDSGRLRAASPLGDAVRGAAGVIVREVLADPAAFAGRDDD
jgi:hypothetical protein